MDGTFIRMLRNAADTRCLGNLWDGGGLGAPLILQAADGIPTRPAADAN